MEEQLELSQDRKNLIQKGYIESDVEMSNELSDRGPSNAGVVADGIQVTNSLIYKVENQYEGFESEGFDVDENAMGDYHKVNTTTTMMHDPEQSKKYKTSAYYDNPRDFNSEHNDIFQMFHKLLEDPRQSANGRGKRKSSLQRQMTKKEKTRFDFSQIRDNLDIEVNHKWEDRDEKGCKNNNSSDNKKKYLDNYGVRVYIPSIYIHDTKFYRNRKDSNDGLQNQYSVQLVKMIMPDLCSKYELRFHTPEQEVIRKKCSELQLQQGITIRLLMNTKDMQIMSNDSFTFMGEEEALIKFSNDGSLFGYLLRKTQKLRILEVKDIRDLIKDIRENKVLAKLEEEAGGPDLSFINSIHFDKNNRFIVGQGDEKLLIFKLSSRNEVPYIYQIQSYIFESILCCQLVSSDANTYNCYIAAKVKKQRQIQVFSIVEEQELLAKYDNQRLIYNSKDTSNFDLKLKSLVTINYFYDLTESTKIDISYDFSLIFFANLKENFTIEVKPAQNEYGHKVIQRVIKDLKNKKVYYTQCHGMSMGFYYLACKELQDNISLQHTFWKRDIVFERQIESSRFKVFDIMIDQPIEKTNIDLTRNTQVMISSLEDDSFYIDKLDFREKILRKFQSRDQLIKDNSLQQLFDPHQQSKVYNPINSLNIAWPYLAFSSQNYLVLYNAHDQQILNIAKMNESYDFEIIQIYITHTNDLIFVAFIHGKYMVYLIDLDESNIKEFQGEKYAFKDQFKKQLIFQYMMTEEEECKGLSQIIARGSSRKDAFDCNQKLIIFFLHGTKLYSWQQVNEEAFEDIIEMKERLQFVDDVSSPLIQSSDKKFYYLKKQVCQHHIMEYQEIIQVKMFFLYYYKKPVYVNKSQTHSIIAFKVDSISEILLILLKPKKQDERFRVVIFNLGTKKLMIEIEITSTILIKNIMCEHSKLLDGHIYVGNSVIKVRYDLIENNLVKRMTEPELFDYYNDVVQLSVDSENQFMRQSDHNLNHQVLHKSPANSLRCHKLAYMITDQFGQSYKYILVTPYLHERKIFLNRIKINTDYFYTTIEADIREHAEHNMESPEDSLMTESEAEHSVQLTDMEDEVGKTFTLIVCINLTEYKIYIYTQTGILKDRFEYSNIIKQYGEIKSISNSGKRFIFSKSQMADSQFYTLIAEQQKLEDLKFNIIYLNFKGLIFEKTISVFLQDHPSVTWIMQQNIQNLEFDYLINDNLDVCIRATKITKIPNRLGKQTKLFKSYIFFEKGTLNFDLNKRSSRSMTSRRFSKLIQLQGSQPDYNFYEQEQVFVKSKIVMNVKYLLIYDEKRINYFRIQEKFEERNQKEIGLVNHQIEAGSIKSVLLGESSDIIAIVVDQRNIECDSIYFWDIKKNIEYCMYDITTSYQIIWDQKGMPYIVTKDKVIIVQQMCSIKAFHVDEEFLTSDQQEYRGFRFDGKNHNWLLFREYISLPFSYMTFVIKHAIERDDPMLKGNIFDIEPYNYVFNRSTSFLDGDFICKDHLELNNILENMMLIDKDYLELLLYTHQEDVNIQKNKLILASQKAIMQSITVSALYLAINKGNFHQVDIILQYMTKINCIRSRNFEELYPNLIQYKSFMPYLDKMQLQTFQMERKQVLKVMSSETNEIVKICGSPTQFITDQFFKKEMKEDLKGQSGKYRSFPIQLKAIRFDWLLESKCGKEFLAEILMSENLDYFKIDVVKMIVEYMFMEFKLFLFNVHIPLFLVQLLFFNLILLLNEVDSDFIWLEYHKGEASDHPGIQSEPSSSTNFLPYILTMSVVLIMSLIFNLRSIILQLYMSFGSNYFNLKRLSIEVYFVVVNSMFVFYLFLEITTPEWEEHKQNLKIMRLISVNAIMGFMMKASFFLSLINKISPLIDIIFKVFRDIQFFTIVYIIVSVACAFCFYLVGQNQIAFDDIGEDNIAFVPYRTLSGSLWYVFMLCLGDYNVRSFDFGTQSQSVVLYTLFVVATFVMVIHLLNMLIAIMGNTFAERSVIANQILIRDHLAFVMDNWHLKDYSFKDDWKCLPCCKNKKQEYYKYIVAAFLHSGEENDEMEKLSSLQGEISGVKHLMFEHKREIQNDLITVLKELELQKEQINELKAMDEQSNLST